MLDSFTGYNGSDQRCRRSWLGFLLPAVHAGGPSSQEIVRTQKLKEKKRSRVTGSAIEAPGLKHQQVHRIVGDRESKGTSEEVIVRVGRAQCEGLTSSLQAHGCERIDRRADCGRGIGFSALE
mgnify:CR=1 FL=1